MPQTIASRNQIIYVVKERNIYYKALLEILNFASNSTQNSSQTAEEVLSEIISICSRSINTKPDMKKVYEILGR